MLLPKTLFGTLTIPSIMDEVECMRDTPIFYLQVSHHPIRSLKRGLVSILIHQHPHQGNTRSDTPIRISPTTYDPQKIVFAFFDIWWLSLKSFLKYLTWVTKKTIRVIWDTIFHLPFPIFFLSSIKNSHFFLLEDGILYNRPDVVVVL